MFIILFIIWMGWLGVIFFDKLIGKSIFWLEVNFLNIILVIVIMFICFNGKILIFIEINNRKRGYLIFWIVFFIIEIVYKLIIIYINNMSLFFMIIGCMIIFIVLYFLVGLFEKLYEWYCFYIICWLFFY